MRLLAGAALLAGLLVGCGVPASVPATSPPTPPVQAGVADPVSIDIPKIGATSSLVPTGLDAAGGWEVPPLSKPRQASWFEPGPEPGEPGTAVLLGHINGNRRPGIFARLGELTPGDEVSVRDTEGVARLWRVTQVIRTPKTDFGAAAHLRTDGPPTILLITCGGTLVRGPTGGRYLDNIIVAATPEEAR